jgi:hypothetical protein
MTARQDEQSRSETVWLGTARALAKMHAKGLIDGHLAAAVHAPEFLSVRALIQAAWEVSYAQQDTLHTPQPAQQDEYFVGWVQGYVRRADEARDETQDVPDTWEDDGGAVAGSRSDAQELGDTHHESGLSGHDL